MAQDVVVTIAFWVLAITTVAASIAVVAVRSVFRAAVFLILSFVGVAGLYITLSADFLGVVQILVYAGAVAVLVVFAIMMTHDQSHGGQEGDLWLPGGIIAGLLFLVSAFLIGLAAWTPRQPGPPAGDGNTTLEIARVLFNQYALPFEVASLLLLGAMIGAIVIARED
ncbi:MAG TPA: NADH-quinone oxidoreductase subunit J [Dehalococcoidia bacterium]|nr:NADH-quinone oxidoreductase subunit J [Dehalococcoidia bacterium]